MSEGEPVEVSAHSDDDTDTLRGNCVEQAVEKFLSPCRRGESPQLLELIDHDGEVGCSAEHAKRPPQAPRLADRRRQQAVGVVVAGHSHRRIRQR